MQRKRVRPKIPNENEVRPLPNKDISELKHEEFIRDSSPEAQLLASTITTVHIQTSSSIGSVTHSTFKEPNIKQEEKPEEKQEEKDQFEIPKEEEISWLQAKCIQKFSWLIHPKVIQVSAITIANGGDNVSIYVPIFAAASWPTLLVILLLYYLMVGVWCTISLKLTQFKPVATLVTNYGHYFIPWVLMGLGVYILWSSDAFEVMEKK